MYKRNLQGVHTQAVWCIVQVALDDLGFSPCFHARFMTYLTELFDTMYDYAIGKRPDFPAKGLFRQFNSAVDIPAPLIPLVMEAYPDAKVGNPATPSYNEHLRSALPLVTYIAWSIPRNVYYRTSRAAAVHSHDVGMYHRCQVQIYHRMFRSVSMFS